MVVRFVPLGLLLLATGCTLPTGISLGTSAPNGKNGKHDPHQPLNLAPLPPIEEKVLKQAGRNDTEHYFDQVSFLQQQLAESDDRNRTLQKRIDDADGKLQEREKLLARCADENRKAFQEIELSLRNIQRWRKEVDRLKSRVTGLEKDNREIMESMVRTLEQILERKKAPAPLPKKDRDDDGPNLGFTPLAPTH